MIDVFTLALVCACISLIVLTLSFVVVCVCTVISTANEVHTIRQEDISREIRNHIK